ncbi:VAN3-binding protein-like protein, partial [Tanacetum coccineum]
MSGKEATSESPMSNEKSNASGRGSITKEPARVESRRRCCIFRNWDQDELVVPSFWERIFYKVCVEATKAMGAEHGHLIHVVNFAINVKSHSDILTLIIAAETALRGAATLKAEALKENINGDGNEGSESAADTATPR